MANRSIIWDSLAFKHFSSAIEFIGKDSITNAERIRTEILDKIDNLATNPENAFSG
jgi:plasmid stabilization system protein ParE